QRTFVLETAGRTVFAAPNFLLFLRGSTLMAQRFDLASLKVEGEPVSVADEVRGGGANGRNAFSISNEGMLAYRAGAAGQTSQVNWYTHDGKLAGMALPPGPTKEITLSPDDKRLVVVRGEGSNDDLWLLDLPTGVFSRLTSSPGNE